MTNTGAEVFPGAGVRFPDAYLRRVERKQSNVGE
jgi:hypothetical protein